LGTAETKKSQQANPMEQKLKHMCNEENTGVIALFDAPRKSEKKCVASVLLTDLEDSNDFVFTFGSKIIKSDDS